MQKKSFIWSHVLPSLVASSHLLWYFIARSGSKDFNIVSYFSSASAMHFAWGKRVEKEFLNLIELLIKYSSIQYMLVLCKLVLTSLYGAADAPYILTNMRKTLKLFSRTSSYKAYQCLIFMVINNWKKASQENDDLPHSQTYSVMFSSF